MEWDNRKLRFEDWPENVYIIMTFDKSRAMVMCEGRDDELYAELTGQ